mgnify:CR=1 FL=1
MGEKMFWVPESVLKNLVQPVTDEERLAAVYEVSDILKGKIDRRPSLTPTAEEYARYFNNQVTDEGLAQMAGDRGYNLVKREEVRQESVAEHRHVEKAIPAALAAHVKDTGTPHVQEAGEVKEDAVAKFDSRGILTQTDGSFRLGLGVNKDLNVTGETVDIELELGTFNTDKIQVPHHIYKIAPDDLVKQMDKLVGKPIGEIGQSQFFGGNDLEAMFKRLLTTAPVDAWGFLKSYRIEEQENSALRVYGNVQLTNRGRVLMADTGMALCSIRSRCWQSHNGAYPPTITNTVQDIGGFDLVAR